MHVCIDGVFYVYNLRLIYDLEAYIHLAIQTRAVIEIHTLRTYIENDWLLLKLFHQAKTPKTYFLLLLCLISFTHSKNVIPLENEYDIN